jgi:predicted patatin/cPLA2 family phospholipase
MRERFWYQPDHETDVEKHPGSGLRRKDLYVAGGTGLVVQGGGMRGVFAMGALAELDAQGLAQRFDHAIGNSSGALAIGYFLAGQAGEVGESYWDQLKEIGVFNPLRLWKIVDVERMIDDAMFTRASFDVGSLRANPTRYLIGVTDARYRLPTYLYARELSDDNLRLALKATAALPGLYNRRVWIDGVPYIDGGFVDTLPLLRLTVLGCTQLVAICTVPLEYGFVNDSFMRRTIIKAFSTGQGRLVRSWIGTPNAMHDENLEALMLWSQDVRPEQVLAIAPPQRLPDFVRNTRDLHSTFELGREAAREAIAKVDWL